MINTRVKLDTYKYHDKKIYFTWQPSVSEQPSCDLSCQVAETNDIWRILNQIGMYNGATNCFWSGSCLNRGVSQREKLKDGFSQERNMVFFPLLYKNMYKLFIFIIKSGNISYMINFYRILTFGKFNWNCSTEIKYLMYFVFFSEDLYTYPK